MSKQQRGLGKGLSALLGTDADISSIRKPVDYVNKEVVSEDKPKTASAADILRIPADLIEPNPYQPRMNFNQEALEELADSIRTLGLIQPITVRKTSSGRYQIISGERRFRASRLTGMEMIPAYIRDTNDQGMLEMAIVENIQRENLECILYNVERYECVCGALYKLNADSVACKLDAVISDYRSVARGAYSAGYGIDLCVLYCEIIAC